MYYVVGNISYTNGGNRNTALSALQTLLTNYPTVQGVTTTEAAGVNSSGGSDITISLSVPDDVVEAFRTDLTPAWTSGSRSRCYVAVWKV